MELFGKHTPPIIQREEMLSKQVMIDLSRVKQLAGQNLLRVKSDAHNHVIHAAEAARQVQAMASGICYRNKAPITEQEYLLARRIWHELIELEHITNPLARGTPKISDVVVRINNILHQERQLISIEERCKPFVNT